MPCRLIGYGQCNESKQSFCDDVCPIKYFVYLDQGGYYGIIIKIKREERKKLNQAAKRASEIANKENRALDLSIQLPMLSSTSIFSGKYDRAI